jgi:hypothetical protein
MEINPTVARDVAGGGRLASKIHVLDDREVVGHVYQVIGVSVSRQRKFRQGVSKGRPHSNFIEDWTLARTAEDGEAPNSTKRDISPKH